MESRPAARTAVRATPAALEAIRRLEAAHGPLMLEFLIDVADGAAEGFSCEGLDGVHFVTATPRR